MVNMAQAFSQETLQGEELHQVEFVDHQEGAGQVSIHDIKEYLKTVDSASTCLDEYLQRRKQLLIKLGLTPVTGLAIGAAGVLVGGLSGVALGEAQGAASMDGWAGLAYAVGGAMIGGFLAITAVGTETTLSAFAAYDIDLIAKSILEIKLFGGGIKSEKLFTKFARKDEADVFSKAEFYKALLTADSNGNLCNGSMVKQPYFKLGFKLKYKVARTKDLKKNLKLD